MSLPNPNMDFEAFDTLPASQLDDLVENIEALADGSGLADNSVVSSKLSSGVCVQMVSSLVSAVATGTTTMPFDDTIPQSNEGDQYMSVTITPKSATNQLVILVNCGIVSHSASGVFYSGALFQDATANALAANGTFGSIANALVPLNVNHEMVAGTTAATTFKVRVGGNAAGTTTFNGTGAARRYGGITISSIIVLEFKA